MTRTGRYSPEVRERAVRMVFEHEREHSSQRAGNRLDCDEDRLYPGDAAPMGTADRDRHRARIKELERENRELRRANEILGKASAVLVQAELDRRPKR